MLYEKLILAALVKGALSSSDDSPSLGDVVPASDDSQGIHDRLDEVVDPSLQYVDPSEPMKRDNIDLDHDHDHNARRRAEIIALVPSLVEVCKERGIELKVGTLELRCPMKSRIFGIIPSNNEVQTYANYIQEEIKLYPKEFFEKLGMKYIHLVKNLTFGSSKQYALPVPEKLHHKDFRDDECTSRLYLDPTNGIMDGDKFIEDPGRYWACGMHHELQHLLDYKKHDAFYYVDEEWTDLNPKNIPYSIANAEQFHAENTAERVTFGVEFNKKSTAKHRTFLSEYAGTLPVEDRAEIYSHVVYAPSLMEEWEEHEINYIHCGGAPITKKIRLMKKRLKEFCSEMNCEFWERCKKRAESRELWYYSEISERYHHFWLGKPQTKSSKQSTRSPSPSATEDESSSSEESEFDSYNS